MSTFRSAVVPVIGEALDLLLDECPRLKPAGTWCATAHSTLRVMRRPKGSADRCRALADGIAPFTAPPRGNRRVAGSRSGAPLSGRWLVGRCGCNHSARCGWLPAVPARLSDRPRGRTRRRSWVGATSCRWCGTAARRRRVSETGCPLQDDSRPCPQAVSA